MEEEIFRYDGVSSSSGLSFGSRGRRVVLVAREVVDGGAYGLQLVD